MTNRTGLKPYTSILKKSILSDFIQPEGYVADYCIVDGVVKSPIYFALVVGQTFDVP